MQSGMISFHPNVSSTSKTEAMRIKLTCVFLPASMLMLAHQTLGQSQWTTDINGRTWLSTVNPNPLPSQVNVATNFNAVGIQSCFSIFGGQGNLHNFNLMELHSAANNRGFMRFYRGNDQTEQMGRIFFNDAANLGFNLQATAQGGTLWGRNRANLTTLDIYGNGWRLIDDVNFNANGYTANPRVGYMALGHAANMDVNSANYVLPISRFTLVHSTAPDATAVSSAQVSSAIAGYRPWMRNMITLVGNGNLGFVGQKFRMSGSTETSDSTDVVIGTSDDNLPANTSRYGNISFRYSTTPGAANVGSAGTLESLETMRIRHARTSSTDPIQGFVGIGDWINTVGSPVPDERLDILDRTVRIRQLPTNTYFAPDADDDKVVVVRSDGRLNWRTLPGGGGTDCDWDPAIGDIATAYKPSSAALCPE